MNLGYHALYSLVERECYWLSKRVDAFKGKKIVLFPAGPTSQEFYYTLLDDYGIEAEFFIDNNPALEGNILCGKPVKFHPWEQNLSFNKEYAILISTMAKYYYQIAEQLEKSYEVGYMHSSAFCACQLWDGYKKNIERVGR